MFARHLPLLTIVLSLLANFSLMAATPDQEKAFVEAYKKAFEAKDEKALKGFLYTKDAHPMALEFYTMMITEGAGAKNATFELVDLTPAEKKEAISVQEGPDGAKVKMPLKPIKKLIINVATAEAGNTSNSTSQIYIAESGDKLVIPIPVPAQ